MRQAGLKEGDVVWITGSTGYLGSRFAETWESRRPGVKAILLNRKPVPDAGPFRSVSPASRERGFQLEELSELRRAHPPKAILHFATHFLNAYREAEADAMIEANIAFPTRLLEACRGLADLSFVNFGSFYSHADGGDDRPMSFYAASKRAFETFLRFYCDAGALNAITLKVYDSYGPKDSRKKLIPKLVEINETRQPIDVSPGMQKLSFVYVDDIVDATYRALELLGEAASAGRHACDVYQLPAAADPEAFPTLREVAAAFSAAAGRELPIRFGVQAYRPGEIMSPRLPFPILPGWQPKIDLIEGFKRTIMDAKQGRP